MNLARLLCLAFLISNSAALALGQSSNLDAALRQSAQDGNLPAVKDLIARGASVNAKDRNGQTALLWVAPARDNSDLVKFLISQGAEVDWKDRDGNTALMIAASQSNPKIMSALIEAGANTNAQKNDGQTPLMFAAARANLDEIRILLDHGADLKLTDKKGRLALDLAREGSGNYSDDENKQRFAETLKLLTPPIVLTQAKPDFSGRWTSEPETTTPAQGAAPAGDQRPAARAGDFGSGWGTNLTITQNAGQLTVEYPYFSRYDMQPPLKFIYALDGSETKNSVMMGRGMQAQTSRTVWDGDRLVITTMHSFQNPADGQPMKIEMKQTIWLESSTLIVETTKAAVLGGPVAKTRTVYRKLTARTGGV